jgi:hypothetical protein
MRRLRRALGAVLFFYEAVFLHLGYYCLRVLQGNLWGYVVFGD